MECKRTKSGSKSSVKLNGLIKYVTTMPHYVTGLSASVVDYNCTITWGVDEANRGDAFEMEVYQSTNPVSGFEVWESSIYDEQTFSEIFGLEHPYYYYVRIRTKWIEQNYFGPWKYTDVFYVG